jgi:hypothetical protein
MKKLLSITCVFGIFTFALNAQATIMTADPSVEALTASSGAVATLEVISMVANLEDGKIITSVHAKVLNVIKGEIAQSNIVIKVFGGAIEGRGMSVSGTANYKVGYKFVSFLNPLKNSTAFSTRAMSLGAMKIQENPQGGALIAVRSTQGVEIATKIKGKIAPQVALQFKLDNLLNRIENTVMFQQNLGSQFNAPKGLDLSQQ